MEHSHWRPEETRIIDNKPVKFQDVCVHEFFMGDVDDPMLYAADPIYKWTSSEAGKWIIEHAEEPPYWTQQMDMYQWGHHFRIIARLSESNLLFWQLKWGKR